LSSIFILENRVPSAHSSILTIRDLEFLLAHGADVNAANKAGHTALMRAMPDLAKIKLLVQHRANVNAVSSGGNTSLLLAAHIRSASVPSSTNETAPTWMPIIFFPVAMV
jgi:ankyrin repeat protein